MMISDFKKSAVILAASLMVAAGSAQARILGNEEAQQATTPVLQDEASLFSSIRMGIALSMAQCEGREQCTPSVNADEVKSLLETLNTRINDLTLRQESVEDPDAFQQVLARYVDERDNYSSVLERLGSVEEDIDDIGIESEVVEIEEAGFDETLSEDETFTEPAPDTAVIQEELEFFEDADLKLQDDESLEEFEDDFDPEAIEPQVQ